MYCSLPVKLAAAFIQADFILFKILLVNREDSERVSVEFNPSLTQTQRGPWLHLPWPFHKIIRAELRNAGWHKCRNTVYADASVQIQGVTIHRKNDFPWLNDSAQELLQCWMHINIWVEFNFPLLSTALQRTKVRPVRGAFRFGSGVLWWWSVMWKLITNLARPFYFSKSIVGFPWILFMILEDWLLLNLPMVIQISFMITNFNKNCLTIFLFIINFRPCADNERLKKWQYPSRYYT